jgi:hypothetical protein
MIVTFPWWFPREYLALLGLFVWCLMIGGPILFFDWLQNRRERHAATAAPESRPKSAE